MIWLGMAMAVLGFALVVPRGARPSGSSPRHFVTRGQVITTSGYDEPIALDAWKIRLAGAGLLITGLAVVFAAA